MRKRYQGRHRRPTTRRMPSAAVARPALAVAAVAGVSLGMATPAYAHPGDHVVQAGTTLSTLAAEHGTSWRTVYADNAATIGADPNRLSIGQVLAIGGPAPTSVAPLAFAPSAATPSASGQYVVQSGDTLSRIAARNGTTWQQLYALNRDVIGPNPGVLRIGQRLTLGGTASAAPAPAPAPGTSGAPTPSSTPYSSWAADVRPVVADITARFGVPTVYTRPGHSPTQERAADFMVYSDRGRGDAVAQYAIDNASRLGVEYVIWQQRIYLIGSGTWRAMADRGSPTANHLDHVHLSFR